LKTVSTSMRLLPFFILLSFALISCEQTYSPKPTGYPRIDLPQHKYRNYESECPFTFRYPVYAEIKKDSSVGAEPCWFQVYFSQFNANVHMSYKQVTSDSILYQLMTDAEGFASKHSSKAEDIYDSVFVYPGRNSGVLYRIEGNTASSVQFYATDSVKHFVRGALYFNSRPNKDSTAPVIDFIRADIDTMLKSLRFR
jgi:gliding motility-associated lipoprotein GldD